MLFEKVKTMSVSHGSVHVRPRKITVVGALHYLRLVYRSVLLVLLSAISARG